MRFVSSADVLSGRHCLLHQANSRYKRLQLCDGPELFYVYSKHFAKPESCPILTGYTQRQCLLMQSSQKLRSYKTHAFPTYGLSVKRACSGRTPIPDSGARSKPRSGNHIQWSCWPYDRRQPLERKGIYSP